MISVGMSDPSTPAVATPPTLKTLAMIPSIPRANKGEWAGGRFVKMLARRNIFGPRLFTDGLTRDVLQVEQGQYVLDPDGNRVYGIWIFTDDVMDAATVIMSAEIECG